MLVCIRGTRYLKSFYQNLGVILKGVSNICQVLRNWAHGSSFWRYIE